MKYQIIEKYAEANFSIEILKGWKDPEGNISLVVNAFGKNFGLVKIKISNVWTYWLGIGALKITEDKPAGSGDYITGQAVDPMLSSKIDSAIESGINLEEINPKGPNIWSPSNKYEVKLLSNFINKLAEINSYLSQKGISYPGNDKIIYGEDLTGADILKWTPPQELSSSRTKTTPNEIPPKGEEKMPSTRRTTDPKRMISSNAISPKDEDMWRDKFFSTAASQINTPYYWGGDDPGKGFDCSGLVHWSLNASGLVPGAPDDVAAGQMKLGVEIDEKDLKKGDLVGFKNKNGIPHIGIYTGEGTKYLSASGGGRNTRGDNPKAKVQITDYTRYPGQPFFSSITPLIMKRLSSKNIA